VDDRDCAPELNAFHEEGRNVHKLSVAPSRARALSLCLFSQCLLDHACVVVATIVLASCKDHASCCCNDFYHRWRGVLFVFLTGSKLDRLFSLSTWTGVTIFFSSSQLFFSVGAFAVAVLLALLLLLLLPPW